jgi:diaminohydroxyphosphoribosylaminopyrimidine deaminase / 5-amino-6-(5-phosphoribosylamino)uracil reductase
MPGSDPRWMQAALGLAMRGRGMTAPNPNVGCVIVKDGMVIGRGWTQPGGRPHAEAMALAEAGDAARMADVYVTLEPCAHASDRGPTCADSLIAAGIARAYVAMLDPDPRTEGKGVAKLAAAGLYTETGIMADEAAKVMGGFITRQLRGRPHVTLKLATSLDGRIALPTGESRWITGLEARAHCHLERARCDLVVVGRGTLSQDKPRLDVRLPGLESRTPRRAVLTHGVPPPGWEALPSALAIAVLEGVNDIFVEGGSGAAGAFLRADLVDRLLFYRAPIVIGDGQAGIAGIGLGKLDDAHGRWRQTDTRRLGSDRLEVYERLHPVH